jgi:hypothetical protein
MTPMTDLVLKILDKENMRIFDAIDIGHNL